MKRPTVKSRSRPQSRPQNRVLISKHGMKLVRSLDGGREVCLSCGRIFSAEDIQDHINTPCFPEIFKST